MPATAASRTLSFVYELAPIRQQTLAGNAHAMPTAASAQRDFTYPQAVHVCFDCRSRIWSIEKSSRLQRQRDEATYRGDVVHSRFTCRKFSEFLRTEIDFGALTFMAISRRYHAVAKRTPYVGGATRSFCIRFFERAHYRHRISTSRRRLNRSAVRKQTSRKNETQ